MASYPKFLSKRKAIEHIENHQDWILKNFKKLKEKQLSRKIQIGTSIQVSNYHFQFYQSIQPEVQIQDKSIQLGFPEVCWQEDSQDIIRKSFEQVLKKVAKPILELYCRQLSTELDLPFNKFRVSTAKSRWGSCSSRNDLSISAYALQLDNELLRHLIIHELCHTIHKNHGMGFKKLLFQLSPNARVLEHKLRNGQILLF